MKNPINSTSKWKNATLKDLVFFQRGFDITKAEQSEGNIPVISSSGITSYHTKEMVNWPGVIIGRKGTLGTVFYSKSDYWPHDTTLWSKNLKNNNPRFVYYFIKTLRLENYNVGNANPILNRNHIHSLKIRIPEDGEQEKIASILSSYDDLIDTNRRRIQLLEEAARLLFREWFVYFRFPRHEKVKIVDGLPEGWKKEPLILIWDIRYGSNLPTTMIQPFGKYPVFGADSIIGFYEKCNVEDNVCLVTCRGNGSGNVRRTFGAGFVTNNSFIFKSKIEYSYIPFFFTMFIIANLKLNNHITGSAQPQLTLSNISGLKVLIPTKHLILQFTEIVENLFIESDNLRSQNQKLAQARDLLLPRLMSGAIEV